MYWNEKAECIGRDELRDLQLERLKQVVEKAYYNVAPYRKSMQEAGVYPGDIQTLEDLSKLPFTVKQDLRDTYPYGRFAVPLSEIVRIHASSGTTGKQTVVGYTRHDLNIWSELLARCFACAGVDKKDFVQIAFGYGLFTGGMGIHYGAERIGASVIPASGGNSKRQIMLMKDFGTTTLCCTPSYALYLGELMEEMGITKEELKLRVGIFGAEPWSAAMAQELEKNLGLDAYNIYGLSEVMGPGVAMECAAKDGMHVWEDHFIPEIINPQTGQVLPDGTVGELVFTTLTKEGLPMIRYRTKDLTKITREECSCGRTHAKISRLMGRSDDMLIIRGVNVFPSQVESVLLAMGVTSPYYHLIVDRVGNLDILEIQVEVSDDLFSDTVKSMEELDRYLGKQIEDVLGINCKITLVEPKTLPRNQEGGKAVHVTDKRKLI